MTLQEDTQLRTLEDVDMPAEQHSPREKELYDNHDREANAKRCQCSNKHKRLKEVLAKERDNNVLAI